MENERKTIYLCLAHMSDEGFEQKYVKEAFDTNWVVPMGPNVNAFEKDLESFVNKVASPQPSPEGKGEKSLLLRGDLEEAYIPEMLYLTWMGMAAKIQQRNETFNRQCVELQKRLSADGFRNYIMKG